MVVAAAPLAAVENYENWPTSSQREKAEDRKKGKKLLPRLSGVGRGWKSKVLAARVSDISERRVALPRLGAMHNRL